MRKVKLSDLPVKCLNCGYEWGFSGNIINSFGNYFPANCPECGKSGEIKIFKRVYRKSCGKSIDKYHPSKYYGRLEPKS